MKCSLCRSPFSYVGPLGPLLRSYITFTQFIFRFEIGDAYLGAVSRFMSNAFEYGDALLPRKEGAEGGDDAPQIESNQPYINLATYVIAHSPPVVR